MKNLSLKTFIVLLICVFLIGGVPSVYSDGISPVSVYSIDRSGRHCAEIYADAKCIYMTFSEDLPQNAGAVLYMCIGEDETKVKSSYKVHKKELFIYPGRVMKEGVEYKIKFLNLSANDYTFTPSLLKEDTYFAADFGKGKMMSLYQDGGTFKEEKRESVLVGRIADGIKCNPCLDFSADGIENEDNYVIDIKIKINTLDTAAKVQLFDGKDKEGNWRIGNYIHAGGRVYTRDPLVSPYVNIGAYEKGQWLLYSVLYNVKQGTSNVYLNGKIAAENIKLFGAERPSVFRLDLKNEGEGCADIEIDTVRIYSGTALLDESVKSRNSGTFYIWEFEKSESNINIQQNNGYWGYEENYVLSGKSAKGVVSGACADAITYSVQSADKYVVDAMIKVNTLDSGAKIQLFDAKDESAQWRVGNYIHPNGSIYTRDPLISPAREVGKYETGKWFRYSVIYDVISKKSDVYINGVLTGQNIPLYGVERPTCFRIDLISSGGNGQADFEIDYVKIYGGDTLKSASKKLYSYDSIMEGEMEVKHTIVDGMAFSCVSSFYIKDGAKKQYSSESQKPFIKDNDIYVSKEFAKDILGINVSGDVSAQDCAILLGTKYTYDDRGFFVLSENAEEYTNSDNASVIFEKSDILYRSLIFDNPRGEQMLHSLNKNIGGVHPRILYTKNEINFIKEKCALDTEWSRALKKTESSAISYMGLESRFQGDCAPADKQNMVRTFQEAIHALSRAYLLTGKEIYAKSGTEYMKTMALWDSMSSDVSNLVVGHYAMGMAIGYDSFYAYLSATAEGRETLEKIKKACADTVLSSIAISYRGGDWTNRWIRINDNFAGVCSGGVMALCIALSDEEDLKEDIIILLENLLKTQQIAVSLFYPDGGYYEGVSYGDYALENLCISIEAMFKSFGTDFGLGRAKGFEKAGEFFTYAQSGTGAFNFHDCAQGYVYSQLPAWFFHRYQNEEGAKAHFNAMKAYGISADINTLYYLKDIDKNADTDIKLDRYFGFAEVGTFRNSFDVKNQVFAAFHGGETGLKHDMLDGGQFVFESDGVKWAKDLGKDSYSIPGYFEKSGYKIYRKKTEGENCVVINPNTDASNYFGQKIGGRAKLLFFESAPSCAMAALDLTDLYSRDAKSYKRGYYFGDNRSTFTVRDEISLGESSEIYWFMNTDAEIKISGRNVTLIKGDKKLGVKIFCSEENFSVLSLPCVQLNESLKVAGQSDDSALSKLAIHCPAAEGDVVIYVKLIPQSAECENTDMSEGAIDSWELSQDAVNDRFYVLDTVFDEAHFLHGNVCFPQGTTSAKMIIDGKEYTFDNCPDVPTEFSTDAFKDLKAGVYKGTLTAFYDDGEKSETFGLYVPEEKSESFYENSLSSWGGEDIFTEKNWQLYSVGSVENSGDFALIFGSGESDVGFRSKNRNASYSFKDGSATVDFDVKFSSDRGEFFFECMNNDKAWFLHTDKIISGKRNINGGDCYADVWYSVKAIFNFDQQKFTVYMKEEAEADYRCIFIKYDKSIHSLLDIKLRFQGEFAGDKAYFKNFKVTRQWYDTRSIDFEVNITSPKDGEIINGTSKRLSAYIPFPDEGVRFMLDGEEITPKEQSENNFFADVKDLSYGLHYFTAVSGNKEKTVSFSAADFADEKVFENKITQSDGNTYVDSLGVTSAIVSNCIGADGTADGAISISPLVASANSYINISTNYEYDKGNTVIFETDFKREGSAVFQLECTVNGRTNGKWIYLSESDIISSAGRICASGEYVGGNTDDWHNIRVLQELKSKDAKYYVYYDGKLIKEGYAQDSEGTSLKFASVKINLAKYSSGALMLDNTRWGCIKTSLFETSNEVSDIGNLSVFLENDAAKAKFSVNSMNEDIVGKNIMLIVASYDNEKRICAVSVLRDEIKSGVYDYSVSLENINGGKYVKAMLWYSDNIRPLAKSITVMAE